MTPEEKAKELVEKFYQTCSVTIAGTATIFRGIAKQLAIIAVDEIINLPCYWASFTVSDTDGDTEEYWQEVKQHIQSL